MDNLGQDMEVHVICPYPMFFTLLVVSTTKAIIINYLIRYATIIITTRCSISLHLSQDTFYDAFYQSHAKSVSNNSNYYCPPLLLLFLLLLLLVISEEEIGGDRRR